MRYWLFIFFAAGLLPMLVSAAEVSQPPDLVTYLAHQNYSVMPLETSKHNRQYLTARINGHDVHFTVDTGCSNTEISRKCAETLGLDVKEIRARSYSVGGTMSGSVGVAVVKSFTFGQVEINRPKEIHVLPKDATIDPVSDGLFGYDYLRQNSVILPIGGSYLWYKAGMGPSQESIDRYMLALGFRPAALDYGKGGLRLQSTLKGHPLQAVVDCGAPLSTFNADFVTKTCGLQIQPMSLPIHGVDGRATQGYSFITQGLFFGTIRIPSVGLAACRAPMFSLSNSDAILGYDVLAAHQAIIDFGQNVIWMR